MDALLYSEIGTVLEALSTLMALVESHSCVHVPVVLQTVTSEVLPGLRTLIGSLPPVDVQVLLQL